MNILYIDHYAGSLNMGMEFRPYYLAREWKKLGHNIRIVAADFSHLRKINPDIRNSFDITEEDGIEYQWIKTGSYSGNGAKRAITMFKFCSTLWLNASRIVKEFKPNVVISSSTYPLDIYPAQRIAKLAKCKYIHEGHDLWPLTLTEIGGMSKHHPFVMLMQRAEDSICQNADHIVSLLPNSVEHYLERGLVSRNKFTCIQNGIVLDDWNDSEEIPEEHKKLFMKLREEGKFIVCYLGGHALSNALDVFIDAANLAKNDNKIAFVLVGKGVEKTRLIDKAKDLDNVYFLNPVSKKQVPKILELADVLYVGVTHSKLLHYGMSMNKVYDYMMAAKPIIIGIPGETYNNDVAKFACGITVQPDNPQAIIDAIRYYQNITSDKRKDVGAKGKRAVLENYEYSILAKKFADLFCR